MSMMEDDLEELGPIDFVLIEFPGTGVGDEPAAALLELVEQGIVRIYDLLVIRKDSDGTVSGLEIQDLTDTEIGSFVAFAGSRSGLVGDDDVTEAAAAMEPGTTAVLIVFENAWARKFAISARKAGGQVVAYERIPVQTLVGRLDELEASA